MSLAGKHQWVSKIPVPHDDLTEDVHRMGFGSFSNIYLNSKMSKLRPAGTDDQITLSNIHQVNLKHPTYLFGPEWRKGGVSPIFTKTQKMSKPRLTGTNKLP